MTADDIAAHAQELLDANGFLTLGTVDASGRRVGPSAKPGWERLGDVHDGKA